MHQDFFGRASGRCLNFEFSDGSTPQECLEDRRYTVREIQMLILTLGQTSMVPTTGWISDAKGRLGRRPTLSLTPLADELSVHPAYLARSLRRAFGLSVLQYALRERVRKAADMLIRTDLPMAEIAFDSGFFDQSHFSNACQRIAGFNPAVIRRFAHG